ncbi:scavenger receptor cysteine-rich domain superfamily protein-like isoform X2 [Mytilus californianus]|uniref:scavenger receptor cysteine-rich domain superfamily protein-like isoform X2 n=1 Tax=Mytilus californianus TaxID=6549 RepID=UPI0022467CDA|nr:scavenger receptor cysteine-rich domain superfamily protein-like isoform X2 [Mytilus californianus]
MSSIYVWIIFLVEVKFTRSSELVRLIQANNTGVVQLNHNGSWVILCLGQSENKESKVICQELGHADGLVLPVGSYGVVSGDYFNGYIKCDQGEDIGSCSLVTIDSCKGDYLAVSCYDSGSVVNGTHLSLNNSLSYGQLNWFEDKFQATGQICASSWGKEEAEVACHQLGYGGGLPAAYPKSNELPFLINSINCTGQEQNLDHCIRTEDFCESVFSAGVICFNTSGLNVSISDGGVDFGRVNIEVDGKIGTICNKEWSTRDAEVICRYIGFVAGRKWSGPFPPGHGPVYLSDLKCTGRESLITDCLSSGWRNVIDEDCLDHSHDAGVLCYGSVRLSGGETNDNVKMGRVEVYQGRQWTNLCTSKFDQEDATVVCRQLGYARARVLSSGIFGRSPYSGFTIDISCYGNETDILDCPHTIGNCKYSEYASVVCIKQNVTDDFQIYIDDVYNGEVRVLQYGIRGTVCQDGWDDNDAKVICHQNRYLDGQTFGTIKLLSQIDPIWLTYIECLGNEASIYECSFSMNLTTQCSSNVQPAGVICYNGTGMDIRLVGGNSPSQGRVEVARDGVWGTICDNKWSPYDANVVCQQLGFGKGSIQISSYHGHGTGSVLMDSLQCDGTASNIFDCPNLGWGVSASSCKDHSKDAGVSCLPWLQLSQFSPSYGYLQVWKSGANQYGLVCAEGFDDEAATVVCRELTQYKYGISHCCSAYGNLSIPFAINDVTCTGQESSLQNCTYNTDLCHSGTYASVICTSYIPTPGSAISFQITGPGKGFISLDFAGYSGLICSEGFDNDDATVVCRQKMFASGIAYKHYTGTSQFTYAPRLLSNINCNGTEAYLHQCYNLNWGKIGYCSTETAAGVMCSTNSSASLDLKVRLVNGFFNMEGRVEIMILRNWGTICTNSLTQAEAQVICNVADFNNTIGIIRDYGNGELSPLIQYMKCSGSAKTITDCAIELSPPNTMCNALGVLCRTAPPDEVKVRLSGGRNSLEGRVEVDVYGIWGTICSSSVTQTEAKIVCLMIGFPDGTTGSVASYGNGSLEPQLSSIKCSGSEITLVDCNLEVALPYTACNALGVICHIPVTKTTSVVSSPKPEGLSSTADISTVSSTLSLEPEGLSSTTDISTISSTLSTETEGLSSTTDISTVSSTFTLEPEGLSSTTDISTISSTLTTEPEGLSATTDISTVSSTPTPEPEGFSSTTDISKESSALTPEFESLYSTTDISTGSSTVITGTQSKENENITWVWIVVTVLFVAVVILIIVLIKCRQGFTKGKWQRNSFSQHSFSNANIIRQLSDGSVHAENPLSLLEIQGGASRENQDLRASVISNPRYASIDNNIKPVRHGIDNDGYMVPVSKENQNQPEKRHANNKKNEINGINGNKSQNCDRCYTADRNDYLTVVSERSQRENMGHISGTVMDKKHVCPGCIIKGDASFNDSIRTYVSLVDSQIQRRKRDGDQSTNTASPAINGVVSVDIHQPNGHTMENSEYLTVVPDDSAIKRRDLRDSIKSTLSHQEEIDFQMPEMTTEL